MATTDDTTLQLSSRAPEGSRSARRLRRTGLVPGVIYGTGGEPETFAVDARLLRNKLAHSGMVIEVSLGGGPALPVLVKDVQRHPVRGEAVHVDFLRVDMAQTIQTTATLELVGADHAPGVIEGGVLSQNVVQLHVEALPGDLPDAIVHDVSKLELMGTVTLAELVVPAGVKLLDDPETVIVTITAPSSEEPDDEEIETETGLVGDGDGGDDGGTADSTES